MSAFSLDKIRGIDSINEKRDEKDSAISKSINNWIDSLSNKQEVIDIPRQKIIKNPNNKYSIENIEELKWMIQVEGLIQPLHVKKLEDGNYMLLGGERRLTAIDMLIADPEVKEWNNASSISCVVKDPEDINLPLKPETKEMLSILSTNKTARTYTDADTLFEIKVWKKIIEELRSQGIETIPMEEKSIQIAGRKTANIISENTGVSTTQVKRFSAIDGKGSELLQLAMKDGVISVTLAAEAVNELSQDQQDELIRNATYSCSRVTRDDIDAIKRKSQDKSLIQLSANRIKRDLSSIKKAAEGNPFLSEKDYEEYEQLIEKLKKLFIIQN